MVAPPARRLAASGLQPGCLAALDTATGDLSVVTAPWLSRIAPAFDFDRWAAEALRG